MANIGSDKIANSPLRRHRVLSPAAGVKISPIALGGMSFGDAWKGFMGECSKETAFEIMDHFVKMGGNFIDTARNYQNEQSEDWIGDWLVSRNIRNQMVISTKWSTGWRLHHPEELQSNFGGNNSKAMHMAIERSLKALKTEYIDIYYVHWWDFTVSVAEMMQSLNQLVVSGKVIYLGISGAPAYIVTKCNEYARQKGYRQFSVYQGEWSAADRAVERDIIPMCKEEGMAFVAYGCLGMGYFRKPLEDGTVPSKDTSDGRKGAFFESERKRRTSRTLYAVAQRKKTTIHAIAIAYILHKTRYVIPLLGGRKVEHLQANIEALEIILEKDEIDEIESAYDFDWGYPASAMVTKGDTLAAKNMNLTKMLGTFDWVDDDTLITPATRSEKGAEEKGLPGFEHRNQK